MRKNILLLIVLSFVNFCYSQNLTPQQNKKGKWGFVDTDGKFQIKAKYESVEPFSDGLACVSEKGKYGYLNQNGSFSIPATFDMAYSFDDNYAVCSQNGKFGMIKTDGTQYVDFAYSSMEKSDKGNYYIGTKDGENAAYIISLGPKPCITRYDELTGKHAFVVSDQKINGKYSFYYCEVKDKGKYGFIDPNGTIVQTPIFLSSPEFNEKGIAIVKTTEGEGVINTKMEHITELSNAYVETVKDGYILYGGSEEYFGVITKEGKITIEEGMYPIIEYLKDYSIIKATFRGSDMLLAMDGSDLVEPCEEIVISDGIASFENHGYKQKLNLVDKQRAIILNGKEIWTSKAAKAITYSKPFISWTDLNDKGHLINESGKPVFEEFDEVNPTLGGKFYSVKKNGKYAVADVNGKNVSDWVDAVIPIDGSSVQLVKGNGYNTVCAIMNDKGKMITGYDFSWVYTPNQYGIIPVRLIRGGENRALKIIGDDLYIVGDLSEGMYPITDFKTKKMGVMTEQGKILVTPKYDEVGRYRCGMCQVYNVNKGRGFINTAGTLVVPCKYQMVMDFGEVTGTNEFGSAPLKNYTIVYDMYGYAHYIDKKGNYASEDKINKELTKDIKSNNWY